MLGLIMVLLTIVVVEYPHAHFYNSTPSPCSFTPIIHPPPPPRLISFSAGFKTTLYQRIYCLLI